MFISRSRESSKFFQVWFAGLLAVTLSLSLTIEVDAQRGRSAGTGAVKVITGQPESVVFINNVRHGVTNDAGELDLPRVKAGSYPVRVRSVGFADWHGRVVVTPSRSRELKVVQKPISDEAGLYYQKGDQLREKGRNKEAIEEYEQALALKSVFPQARIGMARSLTTTQDFQEAERQIKAAIKESPRPSAEAHTVLATLRRNQGLRDEAITEYLKALQIARGNSFEAHIGIGITYKEIGEMEEAISHYRKGLVQDMDTEPILYYQFAEILEAEKRYKEAIEAYRTYVRLDPEGELALAAESIAKRLQEELDRKFE
ncbi:MAG: tetratricopeptide repeat protein [Blastocatellia bacterium]|nr:tetratricopeptide repeat protein [Blastocatellia bacterium]